MNVAVITLNYSAELCERKLTMPEFERVHTMTDYYDGPRRGVADFAGQPHLYESTFDNDADNYIDIFRLSPVAQDVFALALEDWQIWPRWETAFHNGHTTQDTHPALPDDRCRNNELDAILKERLLIDDANFFTARGEFRVRDDPDWSGVGFRPLEVKWSPNPDAAQHPDKTV